MTRPRAAHPGLVPPDRLEAAREKAQAKPSIDSGRTRFTVLGPRDLEPQSDFLKRIIFDTTAPCDMQQGMAYRSADFGVPGSPERKTWIFVPDHEPDEPELAFYCDRLNLLPAQPCPHPDAEQCRQCDAAGLIYPRTFQEAIQMARAAESLSKKERAKF